MTRAIPLSGAPDPASTDATRADAAFLRASFDSAQQLWQRQFTAAGVPFQPGHLVLFHTQVHTPCGVQSPEVGPFYCPASATVYLNTDFFDALAARHGLQSGWAAGYVTAHEVGHHVQTLLGVLQRNAALEQTDPAGANARSVLVELQADCYAGVWLHELQGRGRAERRATCRTSSTRRRSSATTSSATRRAGRWSRRRGRTGRRRSACGGCGSGWASGAPASCDTFSSDEPGGAASSTPAATGATPPSTQGAAG